MKEINVRQDELDQYSRRNTLEIFGVSEVEGETASSLKKTVMDIGKSLGVNITEDGIDACHRIRGGNNRPTSGIIVKFLRRDDPDQLLAKRKVKRDFSTRHLGHQTDQPIYVNLSLAPARRVLFAKARKFKNDYDYKFAWVDRAGRVKVKKTDDQRSRVLVINDDEDLLSLIKREKERVPTNKESA